jgi:hypothetical protein
MAESHVLTDLETIAQTGEQIYRDRYQARYEAIHVGKFLAMKGKRRGNGVGLNGEGSFLGRRGQPTQSP